MLGWMRADPIETITHFHNTFEGRDECEVMDYLYLYLRFFGFHLLLLQD